MNKSNKLLKKVSESVATASHLTQEIKKDTLDNETEIDDEGQIIVNPSLELEDEEIEYLDLTAD